ncbi:helix-turn-helix transcriptional regulator [Noviherbaspirillum sp. Root189]|uniref:helix-turn-helix transcriptional regulator n=1 Tax=Noviherbaspirillum sp. Root189 TaxID=1736487 RepID=UPI0009EB568C|nr:helix-turn-helix transcriptional regulator [Noviherbaspirillum sp. Root189]
MDYPIKALQQLRPILVGFRKQAGFSQAAIASRLGITQQSYAKIEANPAATSVERLFTILRLLGTEIVLTQSAQPNAVDLSSVIASSNEPLPSVASSKMAPKVKKTSRPAPPKIVPPSAKKESW